MESSIGWPVLAANKTFRRLPVAPGIFRLPAKSVRHVIGDTFSGSSSRVPVESRAVKRLQKTSQVGSRRGKINGV
jgi:hypothetical protein